MTIDVRFSNDARSTILNTGGIAASAGSVTVQAGEGSRFPIASGGPYFYVTLQNAGGTREIVKVTTRAGDIFTITRAQESTVALAFAQGDKVELRLTEQGLQDKIDQELDDSPQITTPVFPAFASIQQAAMPTLTKLSPEYLVFEPSAASVLTLPTTGVLKGRVFHIINIATILAYGIRVNASGGTQVSYVPVANHQSIPVTVIANQDAPTTNAHWEVLVPPKGVLYMDEVHRTIATSSDGASISLPADLLYKNGMGLRITGRGGIGGTLGDLALTFDGVAVVNYVVGVREWHLVGEIVRRGATTQDVAGSLIIGAGGTITGQIKEATDAADLTTTLVLKLNNLNGTDTIEQDLFMVELF